MKHSKNETIEEKLFNLIVELYPLFYKQLTGSKRYKFVITESRIKQICNFCIHVLKKVVVPGEDLIKGYLEYAFGKYAGRKNHYGAKNSFPITWIVSKKLFDEYINSTSGKKWFVKSLYSKEQKKNTHTDKKILIKTKKKIQVENENKTNMIKSLSEFEEKEKQRFYDSIKGLYWCIDFTTLFNPKSKFCNECKNREKCKKILLDNYPNLYKKRITNE